MFQNDDLSAKHYLINYVQFYSKKLTMNTLNKKKCHLTLSSSLTLLLLSSDDLTKINYFLQK